MLELRLELEIALPPLDRQGAVVERGVNCTARLAIVCTIGELARGEQRRDVFECLVDAVVGDPELELADARSVDDQRPAGKLDQLAPGRRVPARPVVADLLRCEQLLAGEGIDERRLSDTRRAEQHCGQSRRELLLDLLETGTRLAGDRDHRDTSGNGLDLCHGRPGTAWRSAFVSTMTGRAPLSQARIR